MDAAPVIEDISLVQPAVEASVIIEEAVAAPLDGSYGVIYLSVFIVVLLIILLWRRGGSKTSKR
jgi:hypothetical protein